MPAIYTGQTFNSFQEFEAALSAYIKEQCVPYTVRTSLLAATFNKERAKKNLPLMPIDFKWKEALITCKHYGSPRQHKHVKGKAKRPNQSTFKSFCCAKFNVNFSMQTLTLKVTKVDSVHSNHEVSEDLSKFYPEFRQPNDDALKEAEINLDKEVKAHIIRKNVRLSGVKATKQDLQNIRNRWRAKAAGNADSPEDQVFGELIKMQEEDCESVVSVRHDPDTHEVQSIFFQTGDMKFAMRKYPEVLEMDTTYQLFINDMKLIVMQVVDCYGKGRLVGFCLIKSETKEIVTEALRVLVLAAGEETVKEIKTVMIDKDPSEIAAVNTVLPGVDVHLCDFHVKDATEKGGKKYAGSTWTEVEPLIEKLRFAHTKKVYDKVYGTLVKVSSTEFLEYFNKNWHNSSLIWSDYQRNETLNLGERSTGRVERTNRDLKSIFGHKKLPVAIGVRRLIAYDKDKKDDVDYKDFLSCAKTKYHKYSKDPVIQAIMRINTPYVGDMLQRQYERSLEPPSANQHAVSAEKCDCKFFTNTKGLPCAHIFRVRRQQGLKIYEHSMVPERWTVILSKPQKSIGEACEVGTLPEVSALVAAPKVPKNPRPITAEQRYNVGRELCERLYPRMAAYGGQQFQGYINALRAFEDLMKAGKRVSVVGLDGSGQPDLESSACGMKELSDHETDMAEDGTSIIENDSEQVPLITDGQEETCDLTACSEKEEVQTIRTGGLLKNMPKELLHKLKLPAASVVHGHPKGRRKIKRGNVRVNKVQDSDDSDSDVDGALICSDNIPSESSSRLPCLCGGPTIRRTSVSKKNHGRVYYVCANPSAECTDFHMWENSSSTNTSLKRTYQKQGMCFCNKPPTEVVYNSTSYLKLVCAGESEKCNFFMFLQKKIAEEGLSDENNLPGVPYIPFVQYETLEKIIEENPSVQVLNPEEVIVTGFTQDEELLLFSQDIENTLSSSEKQSSMLIEEASPEMATNVSGFTSSRKCCVCRQEAGEHRCTGCGNVVHAIPPCSSPDQNSEEGYGQKRFCSFCVPDQITGLDNIDVKPSFDLCLSSRGEVITIEDSGSEPEKCHRNVPNNRQGKNNFVSVSPKKLQSVCEGLSVQHRVNGNRNEKITSSNASKCTSPLNTLNTSIKSSNICHVCMKLAGNIKCIKCGKFVHPTLPCSVRDLSSNNTRLCNHCCDYSCEDYYQGAPPPLNSSARKKSPPYFCFGCKLNMRMSIAKNPKNVKQKGAYFYGCWRQMTERCKRFSFWASKVDDSPYSSFHFDDEGDNTIRNAEEPHENIAHQNDGRKRKREQAREELGTPPRSQHSGRVIKRKVLFSPSNYK